MFWSVLAGSPSYLQLHHTEGADNPVMLQNNLDPLSSQVTVDHQFDLDVDNHFDLLAFEAGREEATGGSGSGFKKPGKGDGEEI